MSACSRADERLMQLYATQYRMSGFSIIRAWAVRPFFVCCRCRLTLCGILARWKVCVHNTVSVQHDRVVTLWKTVLSVRIPNGLKKPVKAVDMKLPTFAEYYSYLKAS